MIKKVGIIGGSGMVGSALRNALLHAGYEVSVFSRSDSDGKFLFDYENRKLDIEALKACDILINLAGANVGAHRWTKTYKQEIYESRVKLTRFLGEILKQHHIQLELYIGASATGYYADGVIAAQDENAPAGNDFLAQVCSDWEKAHLQAAKSSQRYIILRTGVVMSNAGGFLPRILPIIKWGLAAPLGNGNQIMPWIAEVDLVGMMLYAIQNNSLQGIYNAVAPDKLTNKDSMRILCEHWGKRFWLPSVPAFIIKLLFGEFSVELLGSRNVVPRRMQEAGYHWTYSQFSELKLK